MGVEELDQDTGKFLAELYRLSKGNTAFSISMYQLGETLGMDRTVASKTAEKLMGCNFVEIKTLSGAIGITAAAVGELKEKDEKEGPDQPGVTALPRGPLIDSASRAAIESVLTALKYHIQETGLNFEGITGVAADIKTIEAQLTSPSPKTAIIRECFASLKSWMDKTSQPLLKDRIRSILGN